LAGKSSYFVSFFGDYRKWKVANVAMLASVEFAIEAIAEVETSNLLIARILSNARWKIDRIAPIL